jgi:hypothetical protein
VTNRAYRTALAHIVLRIPIEGDLTATDWDAALDLTNAYIDIAIERERDEDTCARAALAACRLIGDYQLRLGLAPELVASQRTNPLVDVSKHMH